MIGIAAAWIVVLLFGGGLALDRVLNDAVTRNFDNQLEYVLTAMIASAGATPAEWAGPAPARLHTRRKSEGLIPGGACAGAELSRQDCPVSLREDGATGDLHFHKIGRSLETIS